jgi:hypothetical protein
MASGVPVIARDEGGPSEIVAHNKSGYLVAPSDLDTFVDKILALGQNNSLRQQMAQESRRMAEEATWEKINNRVAWKLAEALPAETQTPQPNREIVQGFSIPMYSWLLLHPDLRDFLGRVLVDFRLMGGIGVIVGVWAGLVVTWLLVKLSLLVRTRVPWLRGCLLE